MKEIKFKIDPKSNLSKGQIIIAKAIWYVGEDVAMGHDRYKVPKSVEELIGKIRYWDHDPDDTISETPGKYDDEIKPGDPYVLIYLDD